MDWLQLFSDFDLKATARQPLYRRLVDTVTQAIESGNLERGYRLPTTRELANHLKIDRSTVSRAYDELSAAGYIRSHVGRGTFVELEPASKTQVSSQPSLTRSTSASASISAASTASTAASASAPTFETLDWRRRYSTYANQLFDLMEQQPQMSNAEGLISFAQGVPSSDSYPQREFSSILQSILKDNPDSLFAFSPASGEPALRAAVVDHLKKRQVTVRDNELMILSGSQQGIDLISNLFVDNRDVVITENPTYFWAISNFKARQAEIIGCDLDEHGVRLDQLEQALAGRRAKFVYLMPSSQNPTGITMSLERRRAVLALAARYATPIFEDDFAGDLNYDGPALPPLKAMPGGHDTVIYQGTFSKALAPGIRLGWLVAPSPVIERINFAKRGSDLSTNSMAQALLTEFLRRGSYDRHLSAINQTYKERRDIMLGALDQHFAGAGVSYTRPSGGLFVWLTLPADMSARDFLTIAQRHGVSFSPGDICHVSRGLNTLRLSFIQNDNQTIIEGIKRLHSAYTLYRDELLDRASKHGAGAKLEHVLI